MRESCRCRTKCISIRIVIGIDDNDGLFTTHVDDKLSGFSLLRGGQGELRVWIRSNRPINVEPGVHDPHFDQSIDPLFAQQIVKIGLAKTCADSRHHFVVQAIVDPLHRLAINVRLATPLIADDLASFDTDQGRNIPTLAKSFGDLVGNKMSVGENLEIDIGVSLKNLKEFLVHKRLAAKQAEKAVAHLLRGRNHSIERVNFDFMLFVGDIDPTTLASKITTVDNRDIKIRRKELTFLQTTFVFSNAADAFDTHVPEQLPKKPFIGLQQHSFRHAKVHKFSELNMLNHSGRIDPALNIPLYRKPTWTHVLCFTVLTLILCVGTCNTSPAQEIPSKVARFVGEVLVGHEYDSEDMVAMKWEQRPQLSVFGASPAEQRVVKNSVRKINDALEGTEMQIEMLEPEDNRATLKVHFVPLAEFQEVARKEKIAFFDNNDGYFFIRWEGNYVIESAVVLIASDQMDGNKRKHFVMEEITQALGLPGDSELFEDSLFYENIPENDFGGATNLSRLDAKLLRFLYQKIETGSHPVEIGILMAEHWADFK